MKHWLVQGLRFSGIVRLGVTRSKDPAPSGMYPHGLMSTFGKTAFEGNYLGGRSLLVYIASFPS